MGQRTLIRNFALKLECGKIWLLATTQKNAKIEARLEQHLSKTEHQARQEGLAMSAPHSAFAQMVRWADFFVFRSSEES